MLWCLATPTEYCTIAHLFGIAHSTVCGIVHKTCQCMLDVLMVDYIKFPSGDRQLMSLKQSGKFPSVLELLTALMCQYQHQAFYILTIRTVRVGTPC